jgi:hypothetical protein
MTVVPAWVAFLEGDVPTSISLGVRDRIGLRGDIGGRTFSILLSTGSNGTQTDLGSSSVPIGFSGTYCWTVTLNASLLPQVGFLPVWDDGAPTYRVQLVRTQWTNATGTPLPRMPPASGTIVAGVIVGAVSIVVGGLVPRLGPSVRPDRAGAEASGPTSDRPPAATSALRAPVDIRRDVGRGPRRSRTFAR